MPNTFHWKWMMTEHDLIEHLMKTIGECEEAMGRAAEVDNAEELREAADSLQRVRERFWPRWTELQRKWPASEGGLGDG